MHKKTENSNGSPKLYLIEKIIGVNILFKAFPNSGNVIAIPNARASYFP